MWEGPEKREDIRAKAWMEVGKEENRKEPAMEVRGGQEEVAIATKQMARGRGCASIGESRSNACGYR